MSLINEALKRARDAGCPSSPARFAATPRYRFCSESSAGSLGSRCAIAATVFIAALAGAAIFVIAHRAAVPARELETSLALSAQHTAEPAGHRESGTGTQPVNVAQNPVSEIAGHANPAVTEEELVARLMQKLKAEQALVAAQPVEPQPPKLVLQGVTLDPTSSEAMINGYTVREGDDVEGARVTAIESRRVKLQFGQREIVLRLP